MSEVWRPIPGYEGSYEASDRGRIRSVTRTIARGARPYRAHGRVLSPVGGGKGYRYVSLCASGSVSRCAVHRLVLVTFVGPCPPDYQGMHLDGDPSNNRLSNLRWGSRSENILDNVLRGTHFQARKTHCKHGHEFTSANTRLRQKASGRFQRVCLACTSSRSKSRRAVAA